MNRLFTGIYLLVIGASSLLLLWLGFHGQQLVPTATRPFTIVCTTTIIADTVRAIVQERCKIGNLYRGRE